MDGCLFSKYERCVRLLLLRSVEYRSDGRQEIDLFAKGLPCYLFVLLVLCVYCDRVLVGR